MRGTVHSLSGNGQTADRYFVFSRLMLAAFALAAVPVLLIVDVGFALPQGLILLAFGAQIIPALLVQNGWTVAEGQGLSAAIVIGAALALAVLFGPGFAMVLLFATPFIVLEMLWLHASPKNQVAAPAAPHATAMLAAMDALVLEHDANGQVTNTNGAGESFLDAASHHLLGRSFFERVHVADRPAFLRHCDEAARGHQPEPLELKVRCGMGQSAPVFRTFSLIARPLTPNEERGPFIAILRRADTQAPAQTPEEQVQDRILAVMTHELRTPLNAIIGFADLLASDLRVLQDDERRRDYARIIRLSGEHLLEVVNTVLDASKLQAGAVQVEPEAVEFSALLEETLAMMRIKAEKNGVELRTELDEVPIELVADKRALRQILINLLSNAVKFSPQGGDVHIRARCEGMSFILTIEDSGVGIAARDIARLGEPFFQAQTGTTRGFEGTGLGLSVVRGLVELHGGTLTIESEIGRGTTVTVTINRDMRRVYHGGQLNRQDGSCRSESLPAKINSNGAYGVKKIA